MNFARNVLSKTDTLFALLLLYVITQHDITSPHRSHGLITTDPCHLQLVLYTFRKVYMTLEKIHVLR